MDAAYTETRLEMCRYDDDSRCNECCTRSDDYWLIKWTFCQVPFFFLLFLFLFGGRPNASVSMDLFRPTTTTVGARYSGSASQSNDDVNQVGAIDKVANLSPYWLLFSGHHQQRVIICIDPLG